MNAKEVRCDLYRYRQPDGSSKDWLIGTTEEGVHVFFGKTGGNLREIRVPPRACCNDSPLEEAAKRAASQVTLGYELIGSAVVNLEDREILRVEEGTSPPLHWETQQPLPVAEFETRLAEIAKALGENPMPGVCLAKGDGSLTLQVGEVTWSLGLSPSPHGHIDPSTGRGGGSILAKHGVVPVLVMMRLAMQFPGTFVFGNDKGETVHLQIDPETPWFPPSLWAKVRKLAVRLKIIAPAVSDFDFEPSGIWF